MTNFLKNFINQLSQSLCAIVPLEGIEEDENRQKKAFNGDVLETAKDEKLTNIIFLKEM